MALDLPDPYEVTPLGYPVDAVVRPPGSKSITNRALICAALADGSSHINGSLLSDDTEAMADCLSDLGVRVDRDGSSLTVAGGRDRTPVEGAVLDARLSGTTSRFIAPMALLGATTVVLDGAPPLRARPMADMFDALTQMGAEVTPLGRPEHLPVQLSAPNGLRGGRVTVRGDASSQFLSGLLLAAPAMAEGLTVTVEGELVSKPYVHLTASVMRAFGARVEMSEDLSLLRVEPTGYRPTDFSVEPDATAASYYFAAAALTAGRVRVEGLSRSSAQGDVAFVEVLESMGAAVDWHDSAVEVRVAGRLRGVSVDMGSISDTAQTLAVVAPFAEGSTTVSGIGFIRAKETDRIAAVVTELKRLGVAATEDADGFTVESGRPHGGVVRTYDDHRMAMSFALVGLVVPGVQIAEPGCVAKTYPGFWSDLEALRSGRVGRTDATTT